MEKPQPEAYVSRTGFDRRTVLVLVTCAVFTAFFALLTAGADSPPPPLVSFVVRPVGLLIFGAGGVWFLSAALRRKLAFSADEQGVTLGNPLEALPGMRRTLRVPWDSVTDVVLFHQDAGLTTTPYVGLRLRPEAQSTPTTFDRDGRLWRANRNLLPHVPEDVLARSRSVVGWRLDEARLVAAVAAFAPHVRVVRLDQDGAVHPLGGQSRREQEASETQELDSLIAAGLPAWTREHTAEWRAAAPGRLLARGLPALAWVLLVIPLGLLPELACTEADPCGTDWEGSVTLAVWSAQIVWLLWLPATAWWISPPLVTALVLIAAVDPSPVTLAVAAGALLVGAWTVATGLARRRAQARRQALARRIAGTGRGWPGPQRVVRLGGRILLGVGLLLLGGWMLVWAVGELRATAQDLATAPRVPGSVTGYREEDIIAVETRTDPPQTYTFEVDAVDEYPVGTRLTVIAGHRGMLAAEPYDASPPTVFGAATMLAGAVVLLRVRRARRRLAGLLGSPHPALAMRAAPSSSRRQDAGPALVLYAADDFDGDDPLLVVPVDDAHGLRPPRRATMLAPSEEELAMLEQRSRQQLQDDLRSLQDDPRHILDHTRQAFEQELAREPHERTEELRQASRNEEPRPTEEELARREQEARQQLRDELRALRGDPQQAVERIRQELEHELAREPHERVEELRQGLQEMEQPPEEPRAQWSATVPVDVYGVPAAGGWLAMQGDEPRRYLLPTSPARSGWRARLGRR